MELRIGIARVRAQLLLGKREREIDVPFELRREGCVWLGATDIRAHLPHVVLDRDRALLKEEPHPDRHGREAWRTRIVGVGAHRVLKRGKRLGVIEVVPELQAAEPVGKSIVPGFTRCGDGWRSDREPNGEGSTRTGDRGPRDRHHTARVAGQRSRRREAGLRKA